MSKRKQQVAQTNAERPVKIKPAFTRVIFSADIQPELTVEEIDRLNISDDLKRVLKGDAALNEEGKVYWITPEGGTLYFHGKNHLESFLRSVAFDCALLFDGKASDEIDRKAIGELVHLLLNT